MANKSNKVIVPGGVDEYIAGCPEVVQPKLKVIRSVIRDIAPDGVETTSYFGIPGYAYEGYDYNGMFAWFSYKKPYIRLHVRPPIAQNHADELRDCKISTGIISFPEDKEISSPLIKKLVEASLSVMKTVPDK